MILDQERLLAVIPHRPPFVMIDCLVSAGEDVFETSFLVRPNNLFLRDGVLSEAALLENMAQSCAAGFGYQRKERDAAGEPSGIGYIGAITRVEVTALPHTGDIVITRVRVTHRFDPVVMIHAVCYREEAKLIEAEIKLVI